ncbi:MAG: hypothetical protein GDA36_05280 [Rhodobacteraceae bacterium]|nr:hypothetical protein [Paracoccaceae bacterium]
MKFKLKVLTKGPYPGEAAQIEPRIVFDWWFGIHSYGAEKGTLLNCDLWPREAVTNPGTSRLGCTRGMPHEYKNHSCTEIFQCLFYQTHCTLLCVLLGLALYWVDGAPAHGVGSVLLLLQWGYQVGLMGFDDAAAFECLQVTPWGVELPAVASIPGIFGG